MLFLMCYDYFLEHFRGENMNGSDFERLSREELLAEVEKRDELIATLRAELQKYRPMDASSARKIAISAETTSVSTKKVVPKDRQ